MKLCAAAILVVSALVLAGGALSAGSFSDTPGDDNAAPDITSVGVSQDGAGSGRGITSGTVACRVLVNSNPVKATGAVSAGAGRCSFFVPVAAQRKLLRAKITVRVDGKAVGEDLAFRVR